MELHDLTWWKSELGLGADEWSCFEDDLAKVKSPGTSAMECAFAWDNIFTALDVDDSLDGFLRMESFLGGVLSSDLVAGQEGCLYAGSAEVDGSTGLMWRTMDTYEGHGYISSTEAGRLMNDEGFQQSLANRFPSLIKDVLDRKSVV